MRKLVLSLALCAGFIGAASANVPQAVAPAAPKTADQCKALVHKTVGYNPCRGDISDKKPLNVLAQEIASCKAHLAAMDSANCIKYASERKDGDFKAELAKVGVEINGTAFKEVKPVAPAAPGPVANAPVVAPQTFNPDAPRTR